MKKINSLLTTLLLTASVCFTQQANAQAPQKMSYQSVLRNSSNVLLAETLVGIKISVLQGGSSGTPVYVETQTATTNANGLLSLQIGAGTASTGSFAAINWATGPYFIKTETDPTGGTAYTIAGTNELMSVPYALFSANGTPGATGAAGTNGTNGLDGAVGATGATGGYPVHTIGESYGGGIVFYVYDGGQHGLIAATADQSTAIRWNGGTYTNTRARGDGIGAGLKNTAIIIANQGSVDGAAFAATVCNEYSVTVAGTTYGDWYLPSKYELNLLYLQKTVVGGFANFYYWSSTEGGSLRAWYQNFNNGPQVTSDKDFTNYVRAVRAF